MASQLPGDGALLRDIDVRDSDKETVFLHISGAKNMNGKKVLKGVAGWWW